MTEALERLSDGPPAYLLFNREERHLAAILFYVLNLPGTEFIAKVLHLAGCEWTINPDEFGIYFEFSYLRDLWRYAGRATERKQRFITDTLLNGSFSPHIAEKLDRLNVREFNRIFVGERRCSRDHIQSPANWQLSAFLGSLLDEYNCITQDVAIVCKLKWAFRVKPDTVIRLTTLEHFG